MVVGVTNAPCSSELATDNSSGIVVPSVVTHDAPLAHVLHLHATITPRTATNQTHSNFCGNKNTLDAQQFLRERTHTINKSYYTEWLWQEFQSRGAKGGWRETLRENKAYRRNYVTETISKVIFPFFSKYHFQLTFASYAGSLVWPAVVCAPAAVPTIRQWRFIASARDIVQEKLIKPRTKVWFARRRKGSAAMRTTHIKATAYLKQNASETQQARKSDPTQFF